MRNECCAHEAAPTEINLNPSVAGNLQTTLHVAGVDCAEEVSAIQRALKPLAGVRDVRVNIMSGKDDHRPRQKCGAGNFDQSDRWRGTQSDTRRREIR